MKMITKYKLSALRGTRPWDDFISKLINTYMDEALKLDTELPIKTVGTHEVTGLKGLELKQNDLIKFEARNDDEIIEVFYALVDKTTHDIKGEQIITIVDYHLVNV
jgi:hypothetical protein